MKKINIETEKKEMQLFENRYRRLFESGRDGILILNPVNGMTIDVNPFLIKMLGYARKEFLNKNISDIYPFKNIACLKQLFKEIQEKEYVLYNNLQVETSDGYGIHVEFESNVYLVNGDKIIQCNIRDTEKSIHYKKKLTDEIDKKEALLNEIQQRIKNSFSLTKSLINLKSSVAHPEETGNTIEELTLRLKSISELYTLLH